MTGTSGQEEVIRSGCKEEVVEEVNLEEVDLEEEVGSF
jgi:hypothetical protein